MHVAEKRISWLTRTYLLASALLLGAFYFVLFRYDNAAPRVDLSRYESGVSHGVAYGTDRCWATERKVAAVGWVARKKHGANRRNVRVVVVDRAGSSAYALSTRLQKRDDIVELLNRRFGDDINYRHTGFSASLNRPVMDRDIRGGRLYIAYDDDDTHLLLPLSCHLAWPQ